MSDDHIGVEINGVMYVKLEDARKLREGWDKADAEIEKLRAALKECVDDLEDVIFNRYGHWVPKYPTERQKRDQDMEPVKKARAALKGKGDE